MSIQVKIDSKFYSAQHLNGTLWMVRRYRSILDGTPQVVPDDEAMYDEVEIWSNSANEEEVIRQAIERNSWG